VCKNKLPRQKAWANGPTAAHTQAHLTALAHHLLTLLLVTLETAGLPEEKVAAKRTAAQPHRPANHRAPAQEMVRHTTQLTCQFIPLVRHCLLDQTRWRDALPLFQRRLAILLEGASGHRG